MRDDIRNGTGGGECDPAVEAGERILALDEAGRMRAFEHVHRGQQNTRKAQVLGEERLRAARADAGRPYNPALAIPKLAGHGASTMPPPSSSRICDGVCHVEELVGDLHGLISSLENRLDAVVQAVPPAPDQANRARASGSHLFERMQSLYELLDSANIRLRSLLERIEV